VGLSVLIFRQNVPNWELHFIFNASVAVFVLHISRMPVNPEGILQKTVRRWYFLVLLLFIYQQTGGLVFLYIPEWLDNQLAQLEFNIFGLHPTIYLEKFNIPILNEYFMLGYFAYFFLILSYAIILMRKRLHFELDMFVTTAAFTFLICFYMFYFFPIAGPRFLFREVYEGPLHGYLFVHLVDYVIKNGAAEGGSMPSTHTAIAIVILVHSWRYTRKVAYVFTPIVFALVIGTFWGRFHFISDTIVGFVMAVICIIISDWIIGNKKLGWHKLPYYQPGIMEKPVVANRKCIRNFSKSDPS